MARWTPPSLTPRHRVGLCAAVALLMHGGVLAWLALPAMERAAAHESTQAKVAQVRWVALPPSRASATPADASTTGQGPAEQSPQPMPDAAMTLAQTGAQATQTDQTTDGDSVQDVDGYVPRRWLTLVPQPVAPVLLPFPDSFNDRAHYKVVLNLFIEADGRVGRVQFEGLPLPEVLQHAAKTTFEHARFTPGQVRGRIVKSLIRVEVSFDNLGAG